jgi:fumarylacetoacetase
MIAHHTISGCNLRTGDMIASGTISGNDKEKSSGSLLEISWNGTKPLKLPNGDKRTFLEDGDTIILTGGKKIPGTNSFIGFGEVSTTILPRKI